MDGASRENGVSFIWVVRQMKIKTVCSTDLKNHSLTNKRQHFICRRCFKHTNDRQINCINKFLFVNAHGSSGWKLKLHSSSAAIRNMFNFSNFLATLKRHRPIFFLPLLSQKFEIEVLLNCCFRCSAKSLFKRPQQLYYISCAVHLKTTRLVSVPYRKHGEQKKEPTTTSFSVEFKFMMCHMKWNCAIFKRAHSLSCLFVRSIIISSKFLEFNEKEPFFSFFIPFNFVCTANFSSILPLQRYIVNERCNTRMYGLKESLEHSMLLLYIRANVERERQRGSEQQKQQRQHIR